MKFYKIITAIKSPFQELKIIVEQFFETEYYFRFRKEKDMAQGNLWVLNDTWSGGMSMFGFMEIKCRQMYNSIRKYDYHYKRAIDGYKLVDADNISYEEKLPFIEKSIKEFLKSSKDQYYICSKPISGDYKGSSFYLLKDKDQFKIGYFVDIPVEGKTRKVIVNWETLETEDAQDYEEKLLNFSEVFYNSLNADTIVRKIMSFCNISQKDVVKAFLQYETFEIMPEDYIKLSDNLKSLVDGRIKILHEIWTYRKLLKKYIDLSDDDECYLARQNDIYKMEDNEAKHKALLDVYDDYKKDKYNAGLAAMEYLIKHEENWIN